MGSRLGLVVLSLVLSACAPESAPKVSGQAISQRQSELHREVVTHTNYDSTQVDLAVSSSQVVVAVINSNLLAGSHQDRDADAARIAHVVEKHVLSRPDLSGVQAIHVDYFARDEAGNSSLKDSMDFRRNSQGKFQHDVS